MSSLAKLLLLVAAALSLSGCEVIGDIFKAGMWTGVIVVIAVIAAIVWLFSRARK